MLSSLFDGLEVLDPLQSCDKQAGESSSRCFYKAKAYTVLFHDLSRSQQEHIPVMFSVERETQGGALPYVGEMPKCEKELYSGGFKESREDRCGKAVLGSDRRPCPHLIPCLTYTDQRAPRQPCRWPLPTLLPFWKVSS